MVSMEIIFAVVQVTGIAAIVFGGALLMPVLARALAHRRRLLRNIAFALLTLYLLVNLYETLLFREITSHPKFQLSLFWSYRAAFGLYKPGQGYGFYITSGKLLKQIILNILFYIPLGYLLPFAWPKLAEGKPASSKKRRPCKLHPFPWVVVLIGLALSVATEFTQLFFKLGLFEFDDIFNNALGCFIGAALYAALMRRQEKRTT